MAKIAKHWPKHAKLNSDYTVELAGLSDKQRKALRVFYIIAEIDEIFDNLNLALTDLDALTDDPFVFGDTDPHTRYKAAIRFFHYEFGRVHDIFGYFLWYQQKLGLLTKEGRRELRQIFYEQWEPAFEMRNTMLHDGVNWTGKGNADITLLHSAQLWGQQLIHRETKETLSWEKVLPPMCQTARERLYEIGRGMRTFWCMVFAEFAYFAAKEGKL